MKLLSTAAAFLLAGLAAAQLPVCPVTGSLKVTAKPVAAGRLTTIKLGVKNTGTTALTTLNVEINLPSNCCVAKGGVMPSLKKTASTTPKDPLVIEQNAYWLNFPLLPKKGRTFSLKVRVSSLFTTATTLPITALVYATNSTGSATCATTAASTLRVVPGKTHRDLLEQEEEEEQEDRELAVVNTAVTCPRTSGTGNSWLFATNQEPLFPIPTPLTTGATPDACFTACSQLTLNLPFYYSVLASGACVCSQSPAVIYSQGASTYQANVLATSAPTGAPSAAPSAAPTA